MLFFAKVKISIFFDDIGQRVEV